MITGINGRIGSGKDTVGKIIQLLSEESNLKKWGWKSEEDILHDLNAEPADSCEWEIKKFAHKLKQIVSILTGIPVKDLEKQEVKDRVLGEEWWYYNLGNKSIMLPYTTTEATLLNKQYLVKPTVRQLLQEIGTNAMRNIIHPNIWVNTLFTDYKSETYNTTKKEDYEYYGNGKSNLNYNGIKYPNWIITDMKFLNELQAVKDRGGITIRVNRGLNLTYKSDLEVSASPLEHAKRGKELHESETALDNAEFDYVIDNNGTIEELIEKVKIILEKENIL